MPTENDMLGAVIKKARKNKKMTLESLAEKIGISARYLGSIENENKKTSYDVLFKLIRTLGISPDLIFYPGLPSKENELEDLIRLLHSCDTRSLNVARATIEALLNNQMQTN